MHIVAHEMQQGQIFSHQERDLLDFYLFIVLLSMLCFMSHFPHLVNMDNDLLLVQFSEKEIGSELPFSTLLRASRSKKSQGSLQIQPATEVHRGGSWYTGQNFCPSLLFRTCAPRGRRMWSVCTAEIVQGIISQALQCNLFATWFTQ